ncbi:MAG: hypothetical protein JWQ90_889 [Hydrocarboniphaga sp.]|uniref:hypothetical protein n=1 Tax=Hydrocarboniphaga sp. TaxID=2033016 RepID=UPI002607EA1C|nr:hypothetical protein [Hydrocarboniphaga sp.]MDB5968439.1 hypothetical protein [Hydrocarboniphaga sp.]
MNQQTQNTARRIRPLAVAALLCASFGSQAADSVTARAASGVGLWIAAQGNAALHELGQELRDELRQQIKPLLPQPTETADERAEMSCSDPALPGVDDLRDRTC